MNDPNRKPPRAPAPPSGPRGAPPPPPPPPPSPSPSHSPRTPPRQRPAARETPSPEAHRALLLLRARRDPVVTVTLVKTLGVALGVLLALVGAGAVVVAAVELGGWLLWAVTLGGVVLLFAGPAVAMVYVSLAHLVESAHRLAERVEQLDGPPGAECLDSAGHAAEMLELLREIGEGVRLTEEEKRALREAGGRSPERAFEELAARVEEDLSEGRWDRALERLERFDERFPRRPEVEGLRGRVVERRAEATAGERRRLYSRITELARTDRWDEACDLAGELVRRFPWSEEAERLRPRLRPLGERARKAERRRLLALVREKTRLQRWSEAYAAARDLVDSFPESDEAAEVFGELPNLRRLARGG